MASYASLIASIGSALFAKLSFVVEEGVIKGTLKFLLAFLCDKKDKQQGDENTVKFFFEHMSS